MAEEKKGRGRPRLNKKKVLIAIDQDAYEILRRKTDKSAFCNDSIKHYEDFLSSRIEEVESIECGDDR